MKKLIRYFFQGLLYVVPLAVTIYVIAFAIVWVDGLLMDREFFNTGFLAKYNFPGVGLILILMLLTLIGYVGQRMISSPISVGDKVTLRGAGWRSSIIKVCPNTKGDGEIV